MEEEIYTLSANGMKRLAKRPELPSGLNPKEAEKVWQEAREQLANE